MTWQNQPNSQNQPFGSPMPGMSAPGFPPSGPRKNKRAVAIILSLVAVVVIVAVVVTIILTQRNNQQTASAGPSSISGASSSSTSSASLNVPGWQTVNDTTPDTYQVPPDWKIENKDSGGVSYVVTEYKLGFCPQDPTGDMANTGTTGGAEGVTDPVKAAQAEEASEFTDPTTQVTTDPAEKTAAGYTLVRMHLTQAAGSDPCPSTKSTFEVVAVPSANGFFLFHIWADQSLPGALPAADIDKIANTFHYSQ